MKLDVKALAMTGLIVWGGTVLLVGLVHAAMPPHGAGFLEWVAVFYPGYDGPAGLGSLVVVTLYGALDGLVTGAIVAWIYNALAPTG